MGTRGSSSWRHVSFEDDATLDQAAETQDLGNRRVPSSEVASGSYGLVARKAAARTCRARLELDIASDDDDLLLELTFFTLHRQPQPLPSNGLLRERARTLLPRTTQSPETGLLRTLGSPTRSIRLTSSSYLAGPEG